MCVCVCVKINRFPHQNKSVIFALKIARLLHLLTNHHIHLACRLF